MREVRCWERPQARVIFENTASWNFLEKRGVGSRRATDDRAAAFAENRDKKPESRARHKAGTHLLPWGCHTIMELVLAALPVETTGALLRTGATADMAAMVIVGDEVCSCGNDLEKWRTGLFEAKTIIRWITRGPRVETREP